VVTAAMSKTKPAEESEDDSGDEKKKLSLKVSAKTGRVIQQIKTLRELDRVEDLFHEDDFEAFLVSTLLADMKKVAERHRDQKKQ